MQKVHTLFTLHIDIAQSKNSDFLPLKGEYKNSLN